MSFLAVTLAVLFAINMGGSGMSPAFAAPFGAKAVGRRHAALLFGIFVLLGAFLSGDRVVGTVSDGIVSQEFINTKVAFVILLSATTSLFIANLCRVSVSTSSVTVFSLISVGLYFRQLYLATLAMVFSFWVALPVVAYILTYILAKMLFPFEGRPWINKHQRLLKVFVVLTGCYVAYSIGSNNVANAVGPLVAADIVTENMGILLIGPFFGVGGLLFRKILHTVGQEITGIGLLGAAVNGIIIASLLLLSSAFGAPEPMVMLGAVSIMGIGSVSKGHKFIATHQVVRKIFTLWVVSPLLSLVVTYLLLLLMHVK